VERLEFTDRFLVCLQSALISLTGQLCVCLYVQFQKVRHSNCRGVPEMVLIGTSNNMEGLLQFDVLT